MVVTRIELVTPAMSRQCSPTELYDHERNRSEISLPLKSRSGDFRVKVESLQINPLDYFDAHEKYSPTELYDHENG